MDIVLHHGGRFITSPRLKYVDGNVKYYSDIEEVCYFELLDMVKNLGYNNVQKMHYRVPGETLETGLRVIADDNDTNKMLSYKDGGMCMYTEHDLSVLNGNEEELASDRLGQGDITEDVVGTEGDLGGNEGEVASDNVNDEAESSESEADMSAESDVGGSSLDDDSDLDEDIVLARLKRKTVRGKKREGVCGSNL